MTISADQIRAGRSLANLTIKQLADRVNLTPHSIKRLESGKVDVQRAKTKTLDAIKSALEDAGIVFMADGFGVTKRPPAQE
jgi:transcriptional regulator with XRE-family HTH domain